MRLAVITPVRNEAQYILCTLESMVRQTVLPDKWIIVNDGSTDETGRIVDEYAGKHPFIEHLALPDRGYRKPAAGVIEAFYQGLARVDLDRFDIVAKFDADLEFLPESIERIVSAFSSDPRLGITGGTRFESSAPGKLPSKVLVPNGFVGGPYKFYRTDCFREIGGLVKRSGWDGVDVVMANMRGWRTGELPDVPMLHLKPTGSADGEGLRKACQKYGSVSYYMGGYFWYFLVRAVVRSVHARDPRIGLYMAEGYFRSWKRREERQSGEFRTFLRRQQAGNVLYYLRLMAPKPT